MRKPRDYDAELKALDDRARHLKARKLEQLGELVVATGADALPIEHLAGALLLVVDTRDDAAKEAQRGRRAALFRGKGRSRGGTGGRDRSGPPRDGAASATAPLAGAP